MGLRGIDGLAPATVSDVLGPGMELQDSLIQAPTRQSFCKDMQHKGVIRQPRRTGKVQRKINAALCLFRF